MAVRAGGRRRAGARHGALGPGRRRRMGRLSALGRAEGGARGGDAGARRAAAHRPPRHRPGRGRRQAGGPGPLAPLRARHIRPSWPRRSPPTSSNGAGYAPAPDLRLRGRRRWRGSLDGAGGATGLLLVTGGSQTRIGSHRMYERLAKALADNGYPCFRFDRRGVGDSDGEDPGFRGSGPDLDGRRRRLPPRAPGARAGLSASACATAPPPSPCSATRPGSTA